jgi:uncharacterized protein
MLEEVLKKSIFKALKVHYYCPQLPASPAKAIETAQVLKVTLQSTPGFSPAATTLIGSSLGGFYARYLAEQWGCKAVLLNPATHPKRDLAKHVGVTTAFHSDTPFEFKAAYLGEFDALTVPRITRPERYFLIAAKGDELLDWREMVAAYSDANTSVKTKLLEGSDHGLSDFADYVDEVIAFTTLT